MKQWLESVKLLIDCVFRHPHLLLEFLVSLLMGQDIPAGELKQLLSTVSLPIHSVNKQQEELTQPTAEAGELQTSPPVMVALQTIPIRSL
ncbi:hypothetical protein SPLC1_S542480 [Arthrospira platensis C1]|nr:hypothetical protein SPLC1_S542480 [Arthrospira platensis C1]